MGNKKSSSLKMMDADGIAEKDVSRESFKLFLNELKDVFWIEKHLAKLIQKMRKAANDNTLRDAFAGYGDNIKSHVKKLEQIFERLNENPRGKKTELMAALAEEAKEAIEPKRKENDIIDARLMLAAQKIQHQKIASYESLIQLAGTINNEAVTLLLQQALSDEKQVLDQLDSFAGNNTDPAHETEAGTTTKPEGGEEQPTAIYDSINLTGKHTKE